MSKTIANNLEKFKSDIKRTETMIEQMNSAYKTMFHDIHSLTGMWTGPAHDAYLAQFQADAALTKKVISNLKSYKRELETACRRFEKCEGNVSQIISGIRV